MVPALFGASAGGAGCFRSFFRFCVDSIGPGFRILDLNDTVDAAVDSHLVHADDVLPFLPKDLAAASFIYLTASSIGMMFASLKNEA